MKTFKKKVELSKIEFTQQKTLQLINKGASIENIAKQRNLKVGTVWNHVANLVEHHQIPIKKIISPRKVHKILSAIQSHDDKLKDIKKRISDDTISYDEIQIVLTNVRGKNKKKSITYYVQWYQKTNCLRKCYFNKEQREECRIRFQQLVTKELNMTFTKKEILHFFHNHVTICKLPEKDKKKFVSWRDFQELKKNIPRKINT